MSLTSESLRKVAERMPQLTSLRCSLQADAAAVLQLQADLPRLVFPPNLLHLDCYVSDAMDPGVYSPKHVAVMLDVATRCCPKLESLILNNDCSEAPMEPDFLAPLLRIKDSLRKISLSLGSGKFPLLVLWRLRQLTALHIEDPQPDPDRLGQLFAAPLPFALQFLSLPQINLAETSWLPRLSSLTHLSLDFSQAGDVSWLSQLSQLQALHLTEERRDSDPIDPELEPSPVQWKAALAHCPRIHTLDLRHPRLTSEHVGAMCASLPQLADLSLFNIQELRDLRFLSSTPHFRFTLCALCINNCTSLSSLSLFDICSLRALRELELFHNFPTPLSAYARAQFDPASPHFLRDQFPHLTHFECQDQRLDPIH